MLKHTFKVENQDVEMVPGIPLCMAYPDVIPDGNASGKACKAMCTIIKPQTEKAKSFPDLAFFIICLPD
jgi:hypothetical protein